MSLKSIICIFKGHDINPNESIVGNIMIDKRNWLCKCHRCGLYEMHDGATCNGTITLTESAALRVKMEFEREMMMLQSLEGSDTNVTSNVPDMDVGDTISRQWLMECVNEGWIKFETEKDENKFIHLVRDTAPSAQPVDKAYLCDWYINSVTESEPIWTEAHISELMGDFYIIPKRGEQDGNT